MVTAGKGTGEERKTGEVENLSVTNTGVYRINLESLMRGAPVVVRVREGVYQVDLSPSQRHWSAGWPRR